MHTYCQASARQLATNDNACAYIVQYLEKLLRLLQSETRAGTRAATPTDDNMAEKLFEAEFLQQLVSNKGWGNGSENRR
jgi:hypothetical protein